MPLAMSESSPHLQTRTVLTKEQAIEIFGYKQKIGEQSVTATSNELASKYNVNSKTIRDIWSGRSWFEATLPLWPEVAISSFKPINLILLKVIAIPHSKEAQKIFMTLFYKNTSDKHNFARTYFTRIFRYFYFN